ncbi:hypothetical protein [Spirosoma sp. 209]|uniref:hypothetical protein n=1 Tax=Spirosoma sp. 209 TaxID=1955701 RepID=UPI00098D7066|nr:hypothetical protein [Spirosoma sp. 209]
MEMKKERAREALSVFLNSQKGGYKAVAGKIGLSDMTLYHMMVGRNEVTFKTLQALAEHYGDEFTPTLTQVMGLRPEDFPVPDTFVPVEQLKEKEDRIQQLQEEIAQLKEEMKEMKADYREIARDYKELAKLNFLTPVPSITPYEHDQFQQAPVVVKRNPVGFEVGNVKPVVSQLIGIMQTLGITEENGTYVVPARQIKP